MSTDTDDLEIMTPAELAAAEAETERLIAEARSRPTDPDLERRVAAAVAASDAYPKRVRREPEGYYAVEAPDVDGCIGTGDDVAAALADWRAAFALWAESRLDHGEPLPAPAPPAPPTPSGRFVVRLPRSVHARLAEAAAAEGVSLNQLVASYLAEGLGRRAS